MSLLRQTHLTAKRKATPALLTLCASLLAFLVWSVSADTALPVGTRLSKGFSAAHYERKGDKFRSLQSTFLGESAIWATTNEVLVKNFKLTTYSDGDTNKPQLNISGPECGLDTDPSSHRVSSTNYIRVSTVNTNFVLEGIGFSCTQSNELLVISNSVTTRLPKSRLASGAPLSASALADAPPDPTNSFRINSDHFKLYYESNLVIYTGHVQVLDSNIQMRCEYLQARFNTNRFGSNTAIQEIIALTNVTVTSTDQGQAWGDQAVYSVHAGGERIELTGHARWQDGLRESKADMFTFNLTPDHELSTLRADGSAFIKLPDSEFKDTNLVGALSAGNLTGATNHFTELYADHVTARKSPIQGIETIVAEDHVVITNRFEQTLATAKRGVYTQTNEQFELSGDPVWQSASKGEIRADYLTVCRTNQSFNARGNSRLTLRLGDISGVPALKLEASDAAAKTNNFLVVNSRDFRYQTNLARFVGDVDARLLQGEKWLGTLNSQLLEVQFNTNNRIQTIQTILAKDHVQAVRAPQGSLLSQKLNSDLLFARFWPGTRFLQNAKAEGNVWGEQVEVGKSNNIPKTTTLNAQSILAQFTSVSNIIDTAVANNKVRASQHTGPATNILSGEHVVYNGGTNRTIELTGNPQVRYFAQPPIKTIATNAPPHVGKTNAPSLTRPSDMLVTGADILIWDLKTGTFSAKGPWKVIPVTTNSLAPAGIFPLTN